MKVLVTGGAGFIGSHLVERLVAEGHETVVLDDLSAGRRENLAAVADRVRLMVGDVRDAAWVERCVQGCARVFHLAAAVSVPHSVAHPEETHEINLRGTLHVLLAARAAGVRRVVFASSAAVYGSEPPLPTREDLPPAPISPYGVEKAAGELYMGLFHRLYGVETVTLRFFNVYGPRQDPRSSYSGVVSRFADAAATGTAVTVFGDGAQTRDFVFVEDVARALTLAGEHPTAPGRTYNIGTGRESSLVRLLDVLEEVAGCRIVRRSAPPRIGDPRASCADVSRAREDLGFAASTDLGEGLRRLLQSLHPGGSGADADR